MQCARQSDRASRSAAPTRVALLHAIGFNKPVRSGSVQHLGWYIDKMLHPSSFTAPATEPPPAARSSIGAPRTAAAAAGCAKLPDLVFEAERYAEPRHQPAEGDEPEFERHEAAGGRNGTRKPSPAADSAVGADESWGVPRGLSLLSAPASPPRDHPPDSPRGDAARDSPRGTARGARGIARGELLAEMTNLSNARPDAGAAGSADSPFPSIDGDFLWTDPELDADDVPTPPRSTP
jgi:hypothetical protein